MLVVSSCLDLSTGNAWSFSPFRTVRFTEETGGRVPAAHSKIKSGAKAKAPDSTAASVPRTIQFFLPCAKFQVPKDVPETPSLSGRESLLQNEAGAWRVRGLKKKSELAWTLKRLLTCSHCSGTIPTKCHRASSSRGIYDLCLWL